MSTLNIFASIPPAEPSAPRPAPRPTTAPAAPSVSQGVVSSDAIWAAMLHTWDHGKVNGSTTHFPSLDPHFTWKPGELTLVTGWPGSGKSEFVLQLLNAKARYDGKKWALFCPENMPVDELVDKLVQSYVGKTSNQRWPRFRMSKAEYEDGIRFVLAHFSIIYPEGRWTLDNITQHLDWVRNQRDIGGLLIDPWNALTSDLDRHGGREDKWLEQTLTDFIRYTERADLCSVVIAHPSGNAKDKDGNLTVPDQYNVSGGRMWANKVDNVLAVYRPMVATADGKPSTLTEIHVHKIKKQDLVGIPTYQTPVPLTYERGSFRYMDPALGCAPLDTEARARKLAPPVQTNAFPASQFEAPPAGINPDTPPF